MRSNAGMANRQGDLHLRFAQISAVWPGLAWPGLAWPGLAWLGLTWPGLKGLAVRNSTEKMCLLFTKEYPNVHCMMTMDY